MATTASQASTWLTCALAIGLASSVTRTEAGGAQAIVVLGVSIAIGLGLRSDRWFAKIPAMIVACGPSSGPTMVV